MRFAKVFDRALQDLPAVINDGGAYRRAFILWPEEDPRTARESSYLADQGIGETAHSEG